MTVHYDPIRHAYIDENGNIVEQDRVREWILEAIAAFALSLDLRTQALIDGRLTVDVWSYVVEQGLIGMHSGLFQTAVGGDEQIEGPLQERFDSVIESQKTYFNQMVEQVKSGEQEIGQGLAARTQLYASAGFSTFENGRRALAVEVANDPVAAFQATGLFGESEQPGTVQERRFLEPGVIHCDECPDLAAMGWQPIGTLPDIGTQPCVVNDRCWFEYRIS